MITAVDTGFSGPVTRGFGPSAKNVETFDVVIIGASVCGAALAAILGEAGVSAAIVADRAAGGRRGEFEAAFSTSIMPDFPLLSIERRTGAFLKIVSSGGKTLNVLRDEKELSFFSASQLETHFTERAMRSHVREFRGGAATLCQENGCWVVNTPNTTIKSRVIVGAGGWDCVVRKAVGAPFDQKDLYFAAGCTARMDGESGVRISLFEGGRFCRTVNNDSKASVAVFGHAGDIVTPKLIFDRVIRSDLAAIKSALSYRTAFVPYPASPQFYSSPCAGKNWILLGEAAGHVHPISGENLNYALRGARFAAQAVECGEPRVFDGLWRDDYGRELEAAVKLKNKMNKWRRSTELAFCAASINPHIKNFMSGLFLR